LTSDHFNPQIILDVVHLDFKDKPYSRVDAMGPNRYATADAYWRLSDCYLPRQEDSDKSRSTDVDKKWLTDGIDLYRQMEVIINVGPCKSHFAVVLCSRKQGDEVVLDLRTTTKVENVYLTLPATHVTHLQSVFYESFGIC
jgi:hypothetical protein